MPRYDAKILTQSRHMADIFEETARRCGQPKKASNWLMGETMRILKEKGMDPEKISFTPAHLADLILALERKEINQQGAKQVFEQIMEKDVDPLVYMKEQGLLMVSDDSAIEAAVEAAMAENQKTVEEYRSGKEKVLGFLVGQVMKKMKGKADPAKVNALLREKL